MLETQYVREKTRQGKVPVSTKLVQGVGSIPDTFKNFAFNTFLLFFYNQVLGMSASLASVALGIAVVFDAITDPVIGSISDNLRSKMGRRHPLMYLSALPLAVSFISGVCAAGVCKASWRLRASSLVVSVRHSNADRHDVVSSAMDGNDG